MIELENIHFKKIREQTGMNKKEFAKYFDIPYRTIVNWESESVSEGRRCPEYVLKLIEFRLKAEKLID